jgi:hypothetical protein
MLKMPHLDQLLGYGTIALGLVFAILAFRLLQSEQKLRTPRQQVLIAIYAFIALSLVFVVVGSLVEIATRWKTTGAEASQPWARRGAWTKHEFTDVLAASRAKIAEGLVLAESMKGDLALSERKALSIAFSSEQCKVYLVMTKPPAEIDASIEASEPAVVTAFGREPHITFGRICLAKARTAGAVLSVKLVRGSGPFVVEVYALR